MSDFRPARQEEPAHETAPETAPAADVVAGPSSEAPGPLPDIGPIRYAPLLPRRRNPWLVVEVDGSAAAHGALVWALREAARREATVVAVSVGDEPDGDPLTNTARASVRTSVAAHDQLEARLLRAIAETGVHGRSRTAVLDRPVFEALTAAARGADLVVVGAHGKTVLRPALPRPPVRRFARGA